MQVNDWPRSWAAELATEVEGLVDETGRTCRSLTLQLSPPILHDLGFEPAIEWLAEEIQDNHGLEVELTTSGEETPLEERVRILLFRAVRELLLNVATHAGAERVSVTLAREGDTLRIDATDAGIALVSQAGSKRGIGLRGIRERLTNLGGGMRVESTRRVGTCITLIAPLDLRGTPTP